MSNVYLAINGDDVGNRIGSAIASDDHEGLANASSSIQAAHDMVDQWIAQVGGKKITGSGDEAIYLIPDEAADSLEEIRSQYQETSGHSLTMGVGSSMSQASKALIYGKLNGKDQVVHYEPAIEDYLSDEGGDESLPEGQDIQDEADQDMEQEAGVDQGDDEGLSDEDDDQLPTDPKAAPKNKPELDQVQEEALNNDEQDQEPGIGNEDDISNDNEEALNSPESGTAPHKTKTQMGKPTEEDEQQEEVDNNEFDGEEDGQDFGDDDGEVDADKEAMEDGEETADSDETDDTGADNEDDHADQSMVDPSIKGQSAYQDLGNDEVAQSAEEHQDDHLKDMIHGDMEAAGADDSEGPYGSSDDQMGDQGDMDAPQDEGDGIDDHETQELKQDIVSALMAFKQNKDMLEQAREQNPQLYDATITMLRSMILMAKKLGFTPEQEMGDQEADAELQDQFPGAEESESEGAEPEEQNMEMGDDGQPQPPQKGPAGKKQ